MKIPTTLMSWDADRHTVAVPGNRSQRISAPSILIVIRMRPKLSLRHPDKRPPAIGAELDWGRMRSGARKLGVVGSANVMEVNGESL